MSDFKQLKTICLNKINLKTFLNIEQVLKIVEIK